MSDWVMSSKLVVQIKLLLSIFFLLLIVGAYTASSFFYETDAFVTFAHALVVGFLFYAVMSDAYELTKYSS